ncbi:hypothetical protein ACQPZJ_35655 [Actinoplanes sp. CA-054009]
MKASVETQTVKTVTLTLTEKEAKLIYQGYDSDTAYDNTSGFSREETDAFDTTLFRTLRDAGLSV